MDKWQKLRVWLCRRHDYLEAQFKETNYSADAAELGAFRAVYQVMKDLDAAEEAAAVKKPGELGGRKA